MLHAALALIAGLSAMPPAAPAVVPTLHAACGAEIDPQFVHYVAPPTRSDAGNPLLWLIASEPPADEIRPFATRPFAGCAHPIQVRDKR